MYGLGQTDKVKGTGVWSAFEIKREEEKDDEKAKPAASDEKDKK
eukprot:CAMPEP_0118698936 /NCGR_PEP_ID=MMETSP0800-20121206/15543_1 /TAXON_ID=210618 ORGANISM="Striatella unipunctata, Strain CCMP2910" /NCGR_SAMPLE_ID=MMETSP0800 /ASSEMBLY_ACC=CAM_ASM_000638 /LENGTH=43 /DNA_ID= /DNA_START= /DNA_END= /DNA_ORIENTATION=